MLGELLVGSAMRMSAGARKIPLTGVDVKMGAMCGRYATTMGQMSLYGLFAAEEESAAESAGIVPAATAVPPKPGAAETDSTPVDLAAHRFNIAPTTNVSVVFDRYLKPALEISDETAGKGEDNVETQVRRIAGMRWGLVPSWAKDPSVGNRMINARAESLAQKPAFRKPLAKRRCLIPASGYFEWRKGAPGVGAAKTTRKQPFYVTPADGSTMAFAGLWEFWKSPDGRWLRSMTIVTTEAVGDLVEIHDRMPLILPASEWDAWLDPANDAGAVTPLLTPPSAALVAELELRPISDRVGNVANDDPSLLDRLEPVRAD